MTEHPMRILLTGTDSRLGSVLFFLGVEHRNIEFQAATTPFRAGLAYAERLPAVVIVDAILGRGTALGMLATIRKRCDCVALLGVANEEDNMLWDWGLSAKDLFVRPFDPELLVQRVKELLVPEGKETKNARASA